MRPAPAAALLAGLAAAALLADRTASVAAIAALLLQSMKRGCYRVLAQDDNGKTSPARGAVLHVDRRGIRTRSGTACIGRHRGLVTATLVGAVRSNALR